MGKILDLFNETVLSLGSHPETVAKAAKAAKVGQGEGVTLATPSTSAEGEERAAKPAKSILTSAVGPKVVDAMRRGREAAADEGADVTAPAPEWSAASWTEKMGVPDSRRIIIPEAVRMKIERIELEARRLGWLPEQLWNADFWRLPRGLAAVLEDEDEIGAVTADYIEILKCQRNVLRFQRRNG